MNGTAVRVITTTTTTTLVVTADNELQGRCRRASTKPTMKQELHIIDPQSFLDDLEFVTAQQQEQLQSNGNNNATNIDATSTSSSPLSLNEQIKIGKLDVEIKLRGQLLEAEIQLDTKRNKKIMTKKRRKKLESRVQAIRKKLALRGPSLLDQLLMEGNNNNNNQVVMMILLQLMTILILILDGYPKKNKICYWQDGRKSKIDQIVKNKRVTV